MNNELVDLYKKISKHSGYQILPRAIQNIIGATLEQNINRYEKERFDFLEKYISFKKKRILDVGGNTGYFSFEAIEAGAEKVVYVEGNKEHAEFVKKAAQKLHKKITVYNQYLDFENNLANASFDIVFLFNVIHHLGDDFGDNTIKKEEAKVKMQQAINYFHEKTTHLILQMGFCWQGDRTQLLFENGTKREMIAFVQEAIQDKWEIEYIGVAEEKNGVTKYDLLNEFNIQRFDNLGEFRNRPIVILRRKI